MNGVNNESPHLICTNIFIKRKLQCTSLEWVLICVSVFFIQSTFKSLCNTPPLTVKSDSFLLQLDGKYEDCRTKKKSFKIIIVLTKGVIEIEFWSIALYGVVVIFTMVAIVITSSYRCRAL